MSRNTKLRENLAVELKSRSANIPENLYVLEISKYSNFRAN